jgi:hypothetical protein
LEFGLDRQNPVPIAQHKFLSYYDLFFPRERPSLTLEINKPSAMAQQEFEFVGLTKEERRALPDIKKIIINGRPKLIVGFCQSKFKVADHGSIHD